MQKLLRTRDAAVTWERLDASSADFVAMQMGRDKQPPVSKAGDRVKIDWGWWMVVSLAGAQTAVAARDLARGVFKWRGSLAGITNDPGKPRRVSDGVVSMALSWDLGKIRGSLGLSRYLAVAQDEVIAIDYYGEKLPPLWRRDLPLGSIASIPWSLIFNITQDYSKLAAECSARNGEVETMAAGAVGEEYAALASLAYRQTLGGLVLEWHPRRKEVWSQGM